MVDIETVKDNAEVLARALQPAHLLSGCPGGLAVAAAGLPAEANLKPYVMPLHFPGIALSKPDVRHFSLVAVLNQLFEHTVPGQNGTE